MEFKDSFFEKVEKKTKVDKNTILSLAHKLQSGNMKDKTTLKEVIEFPKMLVKCFKRFYLFYFLIFLPNKTSKEQS